MVLRHAKKLKIVKTFGSCHPTRTAKDDIGRYFSQKHPVHTAWTIYLCATFTMLPFPKQGHSFLKNNMIGYFRLSVVNTGFPSE